MPSLNQLLATVCFDGPSPACFRAIQLVRSHYDAVVVQPFGKSGSGACVPTKKPNTAELAAAAARVGLAQTDLGAMRYLPWVHRASSIRDTQVNYIATFARHADAHAPVADLSDSR